MKCEKCGHMLNEDEVICFNCGHMIDYDNNAESGGKSSLSALLFLYNITSKFKFNILDVSIVIIGLLTLVLCYILFFV